MWTLIGALNSILWLLFTQIFNASCGIKRFLLLFKVGAGLFQRTQTLLCYLIKHNHYVKTYCCAKLYPITNDRTNFAHYVTHQGQFCELKCGASINHFCILMNR